MVYLVRISLLSVVWCSWYKLLWCLISIFLVLVSSCWFEMCIMVVVCVIVLVGWGVGVLGLLCFMV